MVEYVVHRAPLGDRVTKDLAHLVEVCFGEAPSDLAGRVSEKRCEDVARRPGPV